MRQRPRHDQITEPRRVYNADRTRFVSSWVSEQRDDLWDHDTTYEIGVFDTATGELQQLGLRTHSRGTTGDSGKPVAGVRWGDQGTVVVIYDDGSEEPVKLYSMAG